MHIFTSYQTYISEGVEYTVLKYILNGQYKDSQKIEKPTSELTAEDLSVLAEYQTEGIDEAAYIAMLNAQPVLPANLLGIQRERS